MRLILIISLFFPFVAQAQTAAIAPFQVIDAVTADFDQDGAPDRAVLVNNLSEGADLYVYLSSYGADLAVAGNRPTTVARNVVWVGSAWGQEAELVLTPTGGLQVLSQNDAIGRNRWTEVLTLTYRNEQMLVAGFTRNFRDTLDLESYGGCDVNYLSGRYDVIHPNAATTRHRVRKPAVPVAEWSDRLVPPECYE